MKSIKLLLILAGLLWFGSVAQATENATVYKFGFPHSCDAEFGFCSYSHFFTTQEELNKSNNTVFYLSVDPNSKSRILELHSPGDRYPATAFIINLAKDDSPNVSSSALIVEIDCHRKKYRNIGMSFYSNYFTKGRKISKTSGDGVWRNPNRPIMKAAIL